MSPDGEGQAGLDSLVRELATILGPGSPPRGVGRVEYWIGRVGQKLAELEAEGQDTPARELATVSTTEWRVVDARGWEDPGYESSAAAFASAAKYDRSAPEDGPHRVQASITTVTEWVDVPASEEGEASDA